MALPKSQTPIHETFGDPFFDNDNLPLNTNLTTIGTDMSSLLMPSLLLDLPSDAPAKWYPSHIHARPSYLIDYHYYAALVIDLHEPQSYREASANPECSMAVNVEVQALKCTSTCELTSLSSGKTTVGCRWIYKLKIRVNGSIEHYKPLLVAKGFTQEYGLDYKDTFVHVAHMTTI